MKAGAKGAAVAGVVGVVGAGLAWLLWRRRLRANLPGSVEPDEGGLDEAPPGSQDAEDK